MKKKRVTIIAIICLLVFTMNGQNNCKFSTIFPLESNSSKFEALSILEEIPFIQSYDEANKTMAYANRWWKKPYMSGDSTYVSSRIYKYESFPCFDLEKGTLYFLYANDKLISNQYYLKFSSDEYGNAETAFSKLEKILKTKFPYTLKESIYNSYYNEKIGTQVVFYRNKGNKNKNGEALSMSLIIKYENDFTENINTSKIDHFSIEIFYYDFSKSKLQLENFSWPY